GEAAGGTLGELGWMEDVARVSRRPVMFGLVQNQNQPDDWRDVLAGVEAARARGADVIPQVSVRGVGILLCTETLAPLLVFPAAGDYPHLSKAELLDAPRTPHVRRPLCASPGGADGQIPPGRARVG